MSKRITQWREAAGLTQADLARAVEVSTAAVSMWETGKTCPTLSNLESIARLCGVSIDEARKAFLDKERAA